MSNRKIRHQFSNIFYLPWYFSFPFGLKMQNLSTWIPFDQLHSTELVLEVWSKESFQSSLAGGLIHISGFFNVPGISRFPGSNIYQDNRFESTKNTSVDV